jgi:hypothetical protein
MLFALFGNLLLSCVFSITCSEILPTLSFLGALNIHDRLFVCACTAFALVILVLSLSVTVALHPTTEMKTRILLQFIAVGAACFLVTLSVIDEINGSLIQALEGTHSFMSLSCLIFSLAWGFVVWRESESSRFKGLSAVTGRVLAVTAALAVLTIYEWHFAYTLQANSLVNETVEALCEWSLVIVAVLTPAVLARELPEFTVSLGMDSVSVLS